MYVELTNRRDRKVKHYRDDITGQYRAVFTIHDQHFRDAGNAWQDVNESLVDDGLDGYAKKCDQTQHIVRLGNGGERRWYPRRNVTGEYVSITNIQYWRTTGGGSWRNLNLPTPVWRSQGAEWDLANLYASVTNTWHQIKTEFRLKDSTAPTRLRFEISFTGLTLDGWTIKSGTTVVGYINPPVAWYLSADERVTVPVTASYDGTYIEWSVDTTGVSYPVYVDPTLTDGAGGDVNTNKDTHIGSASATYNYGASAVLNVYTNYKALLEFDFSSIAAGSTCNSAYLHLTSAKSATSITETIYSIASGNAAWIEGTANGAAESGSPCWSYLSYNTVNWAGSAGLATADTDYESSSLGTIVWPNSSTDTEAISSALTTTRIDDWFGSGTYNYGILITGTGGTSRYWHSSDASTTAYRPHLIVDYTAAGGDSVPYITSKRKYKHLIVR